MLIKWQYTCIYIYICIVYFHINTYNDTVDERNPLDMQTYPISFSNTFPYRKLCRSSSVSDPAMPYRIGIDWRWNQIYDRNAWPPDKCNMGSTIASHLGITWVWTVFHLYIHINMIIWLYCQNSGSQSDGLGPTPNIGCWIYMILYASIICKHSARWNSVWCDWNFKQQKNQGDA